MYIRLLSMMLMVSGVSYGAYVEVSAGARRSGARGVSAKDVAPAVLEARAARAMSARQAQIKELLMLKMGDQATMDGQLFTVDTVEKVTPIGSTSTYAFTGLLHEVTAHSTSWGGLVRTEFVRGSDGSLPQVEVRLIEKDRTEIAFILGKGTTKPYVMLPGVGKIPFTNTVSRGLAFGGLAVVGALTVIGLRYLKSGAGVAITQHC